MSPTLSSKMLLKGVTRKLITQLNRSGYMYICPSLQAQQSRGFFWSSKAKSEVNSLKKTLKQKEEQLDKLTTLLESMETRLQTFVDERRHAERVSNEINKPRCCVLIDGDNISASVISYILAEVKDLGFSPCVKRVYGDWTSPQLASWKPKMRNLAIVPIHQNATTPGKNATDLALTIDACLLLNTGRYRCFCIVSSDSDFTPLANTLREHGCTVLGFGKQQTPMSFIRATTYFFKIEDIQARQVEDKLAEVNCWRSQRRLVEALSKAYDEVKDEDGWAQLGEIGSRLSARFWEDHGQVVTDLIPGYSRQLGKLFQSLPEHFEYKRIDTAAYVKTAGKN